MSTPQNGSSDSLKHVWVGKRSDRYSFTTANLRLLTGEYSTTYAEENRYPEKEDVID